MTYLIKILKTLRQRYIYGPFHTVLQKLYVNNYIFFDAKSVSYGIS